MRGSWRPNRTATYWPRLLAITAFLSHSPGLLKQGPRGSASQGHGPHSSIFSPTATAQSRAWGPLCLVLVFSTASYLQLTDFLSSPGLYNCSTPTLWASQIALNSTRPRSRLYPDIPWPDAPVIYAGAFPILRAWPGSICYTVFDLIWYFVPKIYCHYLKGNYAD